MKILGISCFYHDAAACLVDDGAIVAAAQEERFTRVRHDQQFPRNAVRYCLAEGMASGGVDAVAFYDKPILKFHRILETYFSVAPSGLRSFMKGMPLQLREKLWVEDTIRVSLRECGISPPEQFWFPEHHESHAASAFYPSPFAEAAVLTIDGVGEWATATIGDGEGASLRLIRQLDFPHSLGLLYSAFTYFTGFKVNSGEYKLMGLAPYGEPKYADRIRTHLLDLKDDGSFRLDMAYFGYLDDLVMTNERFARLFDGPARRPESPVTRREMDIARSIQEVTEEIVVRMARNARALTGRAGAVHGRRRRAQLRGERSARARGDLRRDLDPARGGRRGRCDRRRAFDLASTSSESRASPTAATTRCRARIWAPSFRASRFAPISTPTTTRTASSARRSGRRRSRGSSRTRWSSGSSTAAWSSARGRSAIAPSSPMRARRRCNRS